MAGTAFHPPIHLKIHPDEPIRTVDDAAKVVERHARNPDSPEVKTLLLELMRAGTPQQVEMAGHVFREWARREGLLLVPPEEQG